MWQIQSQLNSGLEIIKNDLGLYNFANNRNWELTKPSHNTTNVTSNTYRNTYRVIPITIIIKDVDYNKIP